MRIAVAPRYGLAVRGSYSMPRAWQRMQAAMPRVRIAAAFSELDADAEGEAVFMRAGESHKMLVVEVPRAPLR